MKHLNSLLSLLLFVGLVSCDKEPVETYEVTVPVTQSIADFRASVSIEEPREIEESGKIYVYENLIFINDDMKGVLVIDNTNYSPEKVAYIKIPLNTDIAVKGDILFANSGRDLVTFNISNIQQIAIMERVEDVFERNDYPVFFSESQNIDFSGYNPSEEIIVGYKTEIREREPVTEYYYFEPELSSGDSGNSGTGGSMARFNITNDHLYVVGSSELSVFDISNLSNPVEVGKEYVGWQIETIFNKDKFLYLGSAAGMYIYSIEDPATPRFMSQLDHVMGCDPVVVTDDIAYVTIRGGNICGQNMNQLEVIDVSDKSNPQRLEIYQMEHPYGLGVKGDKLFVCEGTSGLKVYDTTNSPVLELTSHFKDIEAYDVIPLEDVLLLIGGNVLRQYSYKNNEISLISTYHLN